MNATAKTAQDSFPHVRFLLALALPWLLWLIPILVLVPRVAAGDWAWGVAVFVISGLLQYWCIIGIHEAIHQYFIKRNRLNGLVAVLCAFPIGLDRNYSWLHLDHHKYFPNEAIDPDGPMYQNFPSSLRQWLGRLLLNASGLQVVVQVFAQRRQHAARPATRVYFKHEFVWKLMVQLGLLALFAMLGFVPGYVLFWLLPLVTMAKLLSFLRTFAEHAHHEFPGALRIFSQPSWLDRYLAHFGFLFHSEHHLRSSVPYTELPQRSLLAQGIRPAGSVAIVVYNGGYLQWHWQLIKALCRPASQGEAGKRPCVDYERILYLPAVSGSSVSDRPVGHT
jgi:fatty acid desaturase